MGWFLTITFKIKVPQHCLSQVVHRLQGHTQWERCDRSTDIDKYLHKYSLLTFLASNFFTLSTPNNPLDDLCGWFSLVFPVMHSQTPKRLASTHYDHDKEITHANAPTHRWFIVFIGCSSSILPPHAQTWITYQFY